MRFYGFGNYYLSSLQQGLQSAHVVGELFTTYNRLTEKYSQVHDWAQNHKTMVLLNGGNSKDLAELFDFFNQENNPYAFAKFHEDEQSLNGALTYVGIVLPSKIYDASANMRLFTHFYNPVTEELRLDLKPEGFTENTSEIISLSQFDYNLCERLNCYGLAK
jgi:hypothetical protein